MGSFSTDWFREIYSRLLLHFGDPLWWPGETPFEVVVGAVLTQNTSWANVERAITNLKKLNLLEPDELARADLDLIASLIKPAGYFNQKAGYLRCVSSFISTELEGAVQSLSSLGIDEARKKLLLLKGVGEETADSILCYAVDLPVFVVDTYTKRIFKRMDPEYFSTKWGHMGPRYGDIQDLVMTQTKGDAQFYNRFHALLVYLGKEHCRSRPKCHDCPVSILCHTGKELVNDTRIKEI